MFIDSAFHGELHILMSACVTQPNTLQAVAKAPLIDAPNSHTALVKTVL